MKKKFDFFCQKVWCNSLRFLYLHSQTGKQEVDFVAQLVEHNTFNVGALGSSPSGITQKAHRGMRFFYACFSDPCEIVLKWIKLKSWDQVEKLGDACVQA